jgi:hypothetical protein|tara:strand:- start:880 stop:1125 length:246 start_codon:yes stop_codon:yes gene_type:complete
VYSAVANTHTTIKRLINTAPQKRLGMFTLLAKRKAPRVTQPLRACPGYSIFMFLGIIGNERWFDGVRVTLPIHHLTEIDEG